MCGRGDIILMITTELAPKFTSVKPHPRCIKLTKEMLGKFAELKPFDHRKVKFDFSVPDMDLSQYDWIVINTSAGKDSMSILRHVVALAERQGVKDRVVAVHCDLKAAEWYGTKELARAQANYYGATFTIVTRPQGDLLQDIRHRGKFPGKGTRYCTSHHKRGQVLKLLTFLAKKSRTERFVQKVKILNVLGHRFDESCEREALLPFTPNYKPRQISNGRRQVDQWYPLHHWTLDRVWTDIRAAGVPWHYAYDLGMSRLSCAFCVFGTKNGLLIAGYYNPELLDRYCEVEQEIGHSFKHKLPIIEIRNRLENGELPKTSGDWKM